MTRSALHGALGRVLSPQNPELPFSLNSPNPILQGILTHKNFTSASILPSGKGDGLVESSAD